MGDKAKQTIATLKALTERVEKATVIDEEEGEKYRVAGRLESLRVDVEALFNDVSGDGLVAGIDEMIVDACD
jgi:hypothetical protein